MTEPPATLIVSGLLDDEADEVAAAFAPLERGAALQRQGLDRAAAQTPDWLTTPATSCHQARSSAVWLRCTRSRQ